MRKEPQTEVQKPIQRLRSIIFEAGLAWGCIMSYIMVWLSGGSKIAAGFLLLGGAILAMNSLARVELLSKLVPVKFIREHRWMEKLHHITDEGEMAGILVGVIALIMLLYNGDEVHYAYGEAFTLLGIMSAANLAVQHMVPIMGILERIGGPWLVVTGGSLLSSLTGEPAASVFLGEYLKDRVADKDRAKLATRLAATIGSGGGLTPFAAPPILIIWGTLSLVFGWSIVDLLKFIGLGCVAHVAVTALLVKSLIKDVKLEAPKMDRKAAIPLLLLGAIVTAHILVMLGILPKAPVYVADALIGLASWIDARRRYQGCGPELDEDRFTAMWQPVLLSLLLLSLEIIGTAADPAIFWLAGFIPTDMSPLIIGFILFLATAITSHLADNALASRVFITVAVALRDSFGPEIGNFFAACVVMGALFGGFVFIPANLPNFYLARVFKVTPIAWARTGYKLYPTGVAYGVWIGISAAIWLA